MAVKKRLRIKYPRVRGRVLIYGVDFGDGVKHRAWVTMDRGGITVRRYRSRTIHWIQIKEAAGILARRSQVNMAKRRMGT